eukprot:TRINITY_DN25181_c1_g2_i4.p3 TRINITY_DN25181_c1_g2~~TRINITY_DN25181_c1_g2_i4.p3  ORF type:complete len:205 (-),score=9.28 TRINITY_DN25181_c1_g2_i4:656-1270(-)
MLSVVKLASTYFLMQALWFLVQGEFTKILNLGNIVDTYSSRGLLTLCDDTPPPQASQTCGEYEELALCGVLEEQYCQISCGRCTGQVPSVEPPSPEDPQPAGSYLRVGDILTINNTAESAKTNVFIGDFVSINNTVDSSSDADSGTVLINNRTIHSGIVFSSADSGILIINNGDIYSETIGIHLKNHGRKLQNNYYRGQDNTGN